MAVKAERNSCRVAVLAFFLASSAAWLLARVALLKVFARFLDGGAGCGETVGGVDTGDGDAGDTLLAAAMPLMPAEVEWREGLVKMGVEVAM
jgi:hypothetical protein